MGQTLSYINIFNYTSPGQKDGLGLYLDQRLLVNSRRPKSLECQKLQLKLETALKKYVSDTCSYIGTVKGFVNNSPTWERAVLAEADAINAINLATTKDSHDKDLEKLSASLTRIRSSLDQLKSFLDAMEKLSVTAMNVFKDQKARIFQTGSADLESICAIIMIAQVLSPLLLCFKRDNEAFFQPKLENMEVLLYQLNNYIRTVEKICDTWRQGFVEARDNPPVVKINDDLSKTAMDQMLTYIDMIDTIRMDEDFRMMYLFQGREQHFMTEFPKLQPDMQKVLQEILGCADKLDRLDKEANVIGVVNSSVGIVSGVLSIAGLIAAPFIAGLSLVLTAAGTGLGVGSSVTSLSTTGAEIVLNKTQIKIAKKSFETFFQHLEKIQCHLDYAVDQHFINLHYDVLMQGLIMIKTAIGVCNGLKNVANNFQNIKAFRAGTLAPKDVGEGMLLSGTKGKVLSGAVSAVSIGVGIYSVVKHSKHLSKGCETQNSKWIRAQVALLQTEVDSLQRMYNSLCRGQSNYVKNMAFLKKDF